MEEADATDADEFPIDEEGSRIYLAENPEKYEYWWKNGVERWREDQQRLEELQSVAGVIICVVQGSEAPQEPSEEPSEDPQELAVHYGQEDRVDKDKTPKAVWERYKQHWHEGKAPHTPYKLDPSIEQLDQSMQLDAAHDICVQEYLLCCLLHATSKGWVYKPLHSLGVTKDIAQDKLREILGAVPKTFWEELFDVFRFFSDHVHWNRVTGAEKLCRDETKSLQESVYLEDGLKVIRDAALRAAKEEMHITADMDVVDYEVVPQFHGSNKSTALVQLRLRDTDVTRVLRQRASHLASTKSQYTSAHKVHKFFAGVQGFQEFESETKAFREVITVQTVAMAEAKNVLDKKSKRLLEVLEDPQRKKVRIA